MEQSAWYSLIKSIIEEHEETSGSVKELRFFHVDTFLKYATHTERFSGKCPVCRSNKNEIESVVKELGIYFDGSAKGRSAYEKRFFAIEEHLKKDHGLVTPKYHLSLYSFSGMLIGTLFGVAVSQVINPNSLAMFLLGGWFLGLIGGRAFGMRKENELKKHGRYL